MSKDTLKETVDHTSIIMDKEAVKVRNEAKKDYSKEFERVRAGGRGPGRGVYLGSKPKNTKGTILRIWNYLGHYKAGLIIVAIGTFLSSVLSVLMPLLFAYGIDKYIFPGDYQGAYNIASMIIVLALFTSIIRFATRYTMVNISQQTIKRIRKDAFDNLQLLPVKYYDQNQSGDIVSKLTNDVDMINQALAGVTTEVIASIITLVGSLIMMFIVNWALAFVVILFIPVMVIFTMKIAKVTRKGFIAQQKHTGALNSIIEESISGIKVVKLYGQENAVIDEFKHKNEQLKKAGFKAQVYAGVIMPVINFLNNLIYLIIVAIGGFLYVLTPIAITVGDISAITSYARQFVQPIANLSQLFNTLQSAIAGAERVFTLIDEPTEYENDGEREIEKFEGHVAFKDVSFGYEEDKYVLKNISFTVEQGKTIAIVGPTGSGKTTIINLINRFYDVNEGEISIDNNAITTYKMDHLRKQIGVVLQDTNLFSGTVLDNIIYGKLDATREEVEEAAKMVDAHDFIMKLPNGYDSEVFEGGQNFSQGERQLISIARTVLSNPDILILDEATSNVDTRTESHIQRSMHKLMQGRTSFVIAHRLQTIRNADKIIVIKDGELIEEGTHHELLRTHGFYYDLYTTQFKDLEEDVKANT